MLIVNSMRLAYGFDDLIEYLRYKKKFTWFNIYTAIMSVFNVNEDDVNEEEKIFQCGAKIEKKMIS